jgi:recombinational DNA repair ATPase RecF
VKDRDYGPCAIDECDNQRRKFSPICAQCSANNHYWEKKIAKSGVQVVRERQHALAKWQHRMIYYCNQETQPRRISNVVRIFPARSQQR